MADSSVILGKYELLEVIGDGAEGRVYKASCLSDSVPGLSRGELVALKRLKNTGHDKESQQFRRQIEILRKLNHPNIVRYKDSFVWREKELEEDVYCLVMELLDGDTLKGLLAKYPGGIPWAEGKGIFSEILLALRYASQNGVVHRDLKPSNIHVTAKGVPKLVDFGIARQDDGEATATSSAAGAKGSFDYMAPDFALMHAGFRGDEQSDIFSFGVLFYQSLAGRLPFPPLGENASRGYYIRWLGQTPPVAEYRQPIFRVLGHARTFIGQCLDVDRAARLKTFDEAVTEFAKIGPRQLKHGADTFEFTEWLGKGGFGEVFRARRVSDGRDVAIKRLFSSGQSARFVREAKILRNAAHPNLTEYVDFVEVRLREDEREYYLVLEYLEGMPGASLRDRIKASESGLEVKEALRIFLSYLSCLEHLHQNGIIHRDIKPGNLYAPANHPEKAKIFDLGIAHDEEGTRTHGQVPGTLDYMPPEFAMQSSGRGSAQSDIYSIGVTLYLALTKSLPFPRLPDKEAEAWIGFIKRSTAPLECAFDHPVFAKYPELVPLLRRALAGDPRRRQASAKAMEDEILGILEGWDKRAAFDALLDEGRKALALQDFDVAERHAAKAVALLPKEQSGRQLLMEVRDGRKLAFRAAVIAASEALAAKKYEEAARQAQLALDLAPADKEARQLLAKAQAGAASPEPAEDDLDERPTAVTMATAEMAPVAEKPPVVEKTPVVEKLPVVEKAPIDERAPADEEATAETRPADLERILQIEKEAAKAEKQAAKVERKVEQPAVVAGPKKKAPVRLILGVAAGVVLLVGLYFGWNELSLRHQEEERQQEIAMKAERASKYRDAMEAGRQAYDQGDFAGAIAQAEAALTVKAGDGDATKLRNDAQAKRGEMAAQGERDRKYREAMDAGRTAFGRGDFGTAIVQAEAALTVKVGDDDATKLRNDAQAKRGEMAAQAALDRKYRDAMAAGRAAFERGDFGTAIVQAEAALTVKVGDDDATKLRNDAQAKREQVAAQAELDRKYQEAMTAGRSAFDREDYGTAITQAEAALAAKPIDEAATKLRNDSQAKRAEIANRAERERKYREAMDAAQAALSREDYGTAITQANAALAAKFADPDATKLRNDAQARQTEIAARAERERKYREAMDAAQGAFSREDFGAAVAQAEAALVAKPGDEDATKLRGDAQAKRDEILARAARERRYREAMDAGRAAFAREDYAAAVARSGEALANQFGDEAATKLRNDSQAALDKANERDRRFEAAMAQARSAMSTGHYGRAKAQADLALGIKSGEMSAARLGSEAQRQLDQLPARMPLRSLFGIAGFDFAWVPSLQGGDGAYVETTVLSQAQFTRLAAKFGMTSSKMQISGTSPGEPENLSYEDAAKLCEGLGGAGQGQFQLPTQGDYLLFSGVRDATEDPNPKFGSLTGFLAQGGANTGGSSPRGVADGSGNKFGLFNVLGNAWEWCDDRSGAGFEFDSTFGSLFRPHRDVQGLYTGVRFVLVPAR